MVEIAFTLKCFTDLEWKTRPRKEGGEKVSENECEKKGWKMEVNWKKGEKITFKQSFIFSLFLFPHF